MRLEQFLLDRYAEKHTETQALLERAKENDERCRQTDLLGQVIPGWFDWPKVAALAKATLADIEANSRIVGIWNLQMSTPSKGFPSGPIGGLGAEVYYETIQILGMAFAEHPDYREEWKP
jgi:hypothetical protein